ncbi:MAG TPA: hypothetical protein VN033_10085 [Vulgatibacter sp.]|nr:hypothetical protein [Vulgatibacter sp.]
MRLLPIFLAALALAGCKSNSTPVYRGEGKLVAKGPAREVIAAPGGDALAWLAEPHLAKDKGHNAPDHMYLGTATFSAFGAPIVLGRDVATLPGSFFFSPTGAQVGAITSWSFKKQSGTLVVGDVAMSQARGVAEDVSFFAFGPDGAQLGWVAEGVLWVGPADGRGDPARIAEGIATFEFSPDGRSIAARRRAISGGQLVLARLGGGEVQTLGERVADYEWSPDGTRLAYTARNDTGSMDLFLETPGRTPVRVGKSVPAFRFSREGGHLAFIGDVSHKKQFGDLYVLPKGASTAAKLGTEVTEFDFDPTGARIAWLDRYSPQSRGGALTWAKVAANPKPRRLGPNVPSFIWSHGGGHLAFVQRQLSPIFSIDLFLADVSGEEDAVKVAQGVFGYSFSGNDERLLFRTNCTRNGRACDLRSAPLASPAESLLVARGIHTYEPATPDESVLLVTYARTDADALDLAMVPADGSASPHMLDQRVLAGTKIVSGQNQGVAYAVLDPARLGVYLAEVPAAFGTAAR